MNIEILTLFPSLFENFLTESLIGKSCTAGTVSIQCTQIRDYADPPQYRVDDTPYGGGPGMVLMPDVLHRAIQDARSRLPEAPVILLTPAGTPYTQSTAEEFSKLNQLILICGRYEGIDQRVIDKYVDRELSIGDFVVMGGEVPAMALIESVVRLLPDVLGNQESSEHESFTPDQHGRRLLEAPQYTRPLCFEGEAVPEVLRSGNHQKIAEWREAQSIARTQRVRPDLEQKE